MNLKRWKTVVTLFVIAVLIASVAFFVKLYLNGVLRSVDSLRDYMEGYGALAPLVLIFIQAIQVVVPILPSFVGCMAGTVLFGALRGFLYNYVGLCLGSWVSYRLARHFGMDIMRVMFSEKTYQKWTAYINGKKSYNWVLLAAHMLPLCPADFLCYFSGLIKMDEKKFLQLTLLGKPVSILLYSVVFAWV